MDTWNTIITRKKGSTVDLEILKTLFHVVLAVYNYSAHYLETVVSDGPQVIEQWHHKTSFSLCHIQYRSDARYKARVIYTSLEETNALVHQGKYIFIHSLKGL